MRRGKKPEGVSPKDWEAVDSPPLTKRMLSKMRPVREAHPDMPRHVRGPQKAATKEHLSIRLSRDVVEHFRAGGPGWQSRIDRALKHYVASKR